MLALVRKQSERQARKQGGRMEQRGRKDCKRKERTGNKKDKRKEWQVRAA